MARRGTGRGARGRAPARHDLVVIGGGPAGLAGALAAGILGQRVALVERARHLGGALVNTGTIPSKTLRETALALSGLRSRELHGVDLSLRRGARVADFLHHERAVKRAARAEVAARLARLGVEHVQGRARFVGPQELEVTPARGAPRRLRARFVLIATGSRPTWPAEFPAGHPRLWDSDRILELEHLPRRLAVIGAGVIGSEYASTFRALGAEVVLVDGRSELFPFLDHELARRLEAAMGAQGVEFRWNERVRLCRAPRRGPIRLTLSSGATLAVDAVLVAAGRRAELGELGLEAAGLAPNERGLLEVDARFRTKVPHVLAAGDVVGFPALASASAEQARVAVCAAFGARFKRELAPLFPSGIYTIPEASAVGATEEELRARGVDYVVGRAEYAASARGAIIGDRAGFVKLLFRRRDLRLLGAHLLGEQATELVHVALMALECGAGAAELERACLQRPHALEPLQGRRLPCPHRARPAGRGAPHRASRRACATAARVGAAPSLSSGASALSWARHASPDSQGEHGRVPDVYSSGPDFDGWRDTGAVSDRRLAAPRTWLLRLGWRRHGLIALHEQPARAA